LNDRRGHASVPVAALSAALLSGAVLLAGCGTAIPSTAAPTSVATLPPPTSAPATTSPSEPASASTPATAAPSPVAGAPACSGADLKASHGIVEGAAGSELTEVVLVSNSACSVDAFPALGLRDSAGGALVGGASAGPGRIDLVAGAAYTSAVRLANWCAPEPSFPLALEIVLGGGAVVVTGDSFPEDGRLPPCSGAGGPILEGTAWEPAET
jgi:hypothetical protein